MKWIKGMFPLVFVSMVVSLSEPAWAANPGRKLEKVRYQRYTGLQLDWPRSAEPIALVKTRYGVPIYERLPNHPYQVLGTMSDEGDHAIKHVADAARVLEADAILVVGDKAFDDAGLKISPQLLENAEIPDPHASSGSRHLDHPEAVKFDSAQPATIRVTQIAAIVIRWTGK